MFHYAILPTIVSRNAFLVTIIILLSILVGCAKKTATGPEEPQQEQQPIQLGQTPWPTFQYDLQHTGRSPNSGPDAPTIKWEFTGIGGLPILGFDGTIFLSSDDNNLYAISSTGSLNWTFATTGFHGTSPVIDSAGTVYIGTDGLVRGIGLDGSSEFVFHTNYLSGSPPIIGPDGTIYAGFSNGDCSGGNFYAIRSSGSAKWVLETGKGEPTTVPAIGLDGTIYFGASNCRGDQSWLYAINSDGTLQWVRSVDFQWLYTAPSIGADGTIYIAGQGGVLMAFDPGGTRRWEYNVSPRGARNSFILGSLAIGADETIYVGSHLPSRPNRGFLSAYSPSGIFKWSTETGPIYGSPIVDADGIIYVGADCCKIVAINPDGTLKWEYGLEGGSLRLSPVIGPNRTIYISTDGIKGDGPFPLPGPSRLFAIGEQ